VGLGGAARHRWLDAARSVNRAPHGREKSRRRRRGDPGGIGPRAAGARRCQIRVEIEPKSTRPTRAHEDATVPLLDSET
jgi:hypothetical protein